MTRFRDLVAGCLVAAVVAACAGGTTSRAPSASPSAPPAGSAVPATPATPTKLTVGLGFVPNVQFAQFYLAQQAGYYREAGLDVTFQNKVDPDLITLIGQGTVDIGIADGTSVIPAVSQNFPIRYVATIYAQFPSVVFAKASSGIAKAADLKGKKIGTPGMYGSSWIMLQALLGSAGLTTADVKIVPYPDYSQRIALEKGLVDAATGFINNEPIQLELGGTKAVVLQVDGIVPLPGNGLITGTGALASKSTALRAFVAATLRAMTEITADPQRGLDAAVAAVPDLAKADQATQLAVLKATIGVWQNAYTTANGLGAIDPDAWTKSVAFMAGLPDKPVARPVTVDELTSRELLPAR